MWNQKTIFKYPGLILSYELRKSLVASKRQPTTIIITKLLIGWRVLHVVLIRIGLLERGVSHFRKGLIIVDMDAKTLTNYVFDFLL